MATVPSKILESVVNVSITPDVYTWLRPINGHQYRPDHSRRHRNMEESTRLRFYCCSRPLSILKRPHPIFSVNEAWERLWHSRSAAPLVRQLSKEKEAIHNDIVNGAKFDTLPVQYDIPKDRSWVLPYPVYERSAFSCEIWTQSICLPAMIRRRFTALTRVRLKQWHYCIELSRTTWVVPKQ